MVWNSKESQIQVIYIHDFSLIYFRQIYWNFLTHPFSFFVSEFFWYNIIMIIVYFTNFSIIASNTNSLEFPNSLTKSYHSFPACRNVNVELKTISTPLHLWQEKIKMLFWFISTEYSETFYFTIVYFLLVIIKWLRLKWEFKTSWHLTFFVKVKFAVHYTSVVRRQLIKFNHLNNSCGITKINRLLCCRKLGKRHCIGQYLTNLVELYTS